MSTSALGYVILVQQSTIYEVLCYLEKALSKRYLSQLF